MIRVLILSREAIWDGGVVNFVEALKNHFSPEVLVEGFTIGRRRGSGVAKRIKDTLSDAYELNRLVRNSSFDVVHLNPSLNISSLLRDGLFMVALRLSGFRKVFVTWHGWDTRLAERLQRWPFRTIFHGVFGLSPSMWVLASFFVKQIHGMGVPLDKIQQYTTMFDGSIFQGRERNRQDTIIRLLFLSRFEKEKGVYELLEAFNEIIQANTQVQLVFAGDGPEMKSMKSWVQEHRLENVITFTGYLRDGDKVQALLDADIFVFPTYYGEGCPVSLLEAMAAGLPVITAPAGGIPDIFQDGINGFLLKKVHSSTIANALMKLLDDPGLREKFGKHNRQEAWQKYEARVVTGIFENQYSAMASGTQGGRA